MRTIPFPLEQFLQVVLVSDFFFKQGSVSLDFRGVEGTPIVEPPPRSALRSSPLAVDPLGPLFSHHSSLRRRDTDFLSPRDHPIRISGNRTTAFQPSSPASLRWLPHGSAHRALKRARFWPRWAGVTPSGTLLSSTASTALAAMVAGEAPAAGVTPFADKPQDPPCPRRAR